MWPRTLWKPSFCIKPHFLYIPRNQGYNIPACIYRAPPYFHLVLWNYQRGLPKEQGTAVHCCFSLWLTHPEHADHIPPGLTEVDRKVSSEVHQKTQLCEHFTWVLPSQRWQSLALGTTNSTQLRCATHYVPKQLLRSSHLPYRGHISL